METSGHPCGNFQSAVQLLLPLSASVQTATTFVQMAASFIQTPALAEFLGRMNGAQMLEYIDNNPQSPFTKYASMFKKVTMLTQDSRDPRIFVDIKDLENFGKDIFSFSKDALNSKNLTKFAKKALRVKSGNIISNVALSSFLLSYVLPKTQFALRELFTGSKLEPGLINIDNKKR